MAGEILFPWVKASTGTSMPFKWTIGNARYEVHKPELESFDLANLLPHVLEVRKKLSLMQQVKIAMSWSNSSAALLNLATSLCRHSTIF